ncbi:MAG: tRNA (guanosine(46)-N7)-methyltransferase TrmB [Fimbriiglobus sp.]
MRGRKKLSAEELAPYQWTPPDPSANYRWGEGPTDAPPEPVTPITPLDWPTFFNNAQAVEIEVGFGKGLFLVNSAVEQPERNFFGIEIVRKYQLYATTRLASRKLPNARTCCADAKHIFETYVPEASVAAVHVYFPDPWWKKRHKKRLLMTQEFAELILKILVPGGLFHFATDVPDYYAWVQETMALVPRLAPLGPPPEPEPTHDMDYLTNFERRFRKIGKPIHRNRYEKR